MERRNFFRSLVAGGATVTSTLNGKPLKHRKADKTAATKLYGGPMVIPPHIAEIVRESPDLHKTRARHLAARYSDDGVTWLFRCQIPASREMIGEIVLTPEGQLRVHCWSAARPADAWRPYRDTADIIAQHRAAPDTRPAEVAVALPPPPSAAWGKDQHYEPNAIDELMREGLE